MGRSPASFARSKSRFKAQPRVLILCEDSKSCLQYLQNAAHHFRADAEVKIAHCGKTNPDGIVAEAIKQKRAFDQIYCAIDRDSHKHFDKALALATANAAKVTVIASYPCYEFWLLLHFKNTRKPYVDAGNNSAGDLIASDLRKEEGMDKYAKGDTENLFDKLILRLPDARIRAREVLVEAAKDNSMNPSTRLHELIDLFEQLGTPQLAD